MTGYTISSVRYLASADPISVLTATSSFYGSLPAANEPIDTGTRATLAFPNDVTASINCDFDVPWRFGFIPRVPDLTVNVECERGSVELFNFIAPVLYHWIRVRTDDPSGKGKTKERIEKTYKFQNGEKGEEWWTTYRYQFESFVDRLKGRTPQHWMSKEESVGNIEWIEKVYEKVCCIFTHIVLSLTIFGRVEWLWLPTKIPVRSLRVAAIGYCFLVKEPIY